MFRYTIVKNDSEDETVQNDLLNEHVKDVDAFDEILNELENVRISLPKSQYTLRKGLDNIKLSKARLRNAQCILNFLFF